MIVKYSTVHNQGMNFSAVVRKGKTMNDLISRQAAIDEVKRLNDVAWENWKETRISANTMIDALKELPSAQQQYEPVTVKDFAKTMSENTLYGFMGWYGVALDLMEKQGFVICKKTM